MSAATLDRPAPRTDVREAVRALLTASSEFQQLPPETRREIAQGLVKISSTALALAGEADAAATALRRPRAFARAQNAGSEFSGVAAQRVADTTRQILNAVSFPRFVTELINGVFKAIVDSNQQQMTSYVELIRNVSASLDGFADTNVGVAGARQWLAERFPAEFVIEGDEDPFAEPGQPLDPEAQAERDASTSLRLRPGASMPSEAALRTGLGLDPNASISAGDPENLVPIARVALARNRQQMLSTMVMLGMQRLVIESGRLHASMRFHIDTRSAAQDDRGSQFDARHSSTASGSVGFGPWGLSATMTNTIGYVSTQQTQTTEEMNTDLDLNSSVELVFKTDYLPLDRLAGRDQVDRIKVNTLNPEAEVKAANEARSEREKRYSEGEGARRSDIRKSIAAPPAPPAAPKAGEPGSVEAADKARKDAAEAAKKDKKDDKKPTPDPASRPEAPSPDPAARPEARSPPPQQAPTQVVQSPPPRQQAFTQAAQSLPHRPGRKPAANSRDSAVMASALEDEVPDKIPQRAARTPDVIFVPSPKEVTDEMLTLANVTAQDYLVDLGCGNGGILVAAAREHGCRALGVDIDPRRVAEARANVERNGVRELVRVEQGDLFEVDLTNADVVMLYLLPHLNVRLIPQLLRMKPGARIVSHDFGMAGVIPDRVVQVFLPSRQIKKTFYLWTTPLKLARGPVPSEWSNANPLRVA